MALGDSNTFSLPSQGAAIAISRGQFNSSLRALLQNFYSAALPDTENFQSGGSALSSTEYEGTLYRKSSTGVLYIYDSGAAGTTTRTQYPLGGKWTRYGIAWRQQGSLAAAASNIADYEIGEAFAVVKDTAGSSNNRLYMRVATTGTFGVDFVDIGKPAPSQVGTTELASQSVTGPKLNATLYTIPTTDMQFSSTVTVAPRMVLTSFANNQLTPTTAVLELKTSTGSNDVSLGFNNGTTSATIRLTPGTGNNSGLGVTGSTNGTLAPLRSNLVLQTTVTGSTNETVAPLIPAGVITAWAGSSAPSGWLLCNGAAVSRTTYAALYVICSTTYGSGDGSTTFNLPDLRNRAPYGVGNAGLGTSSTGVNSSLQTSATTATESSTLSHSVTTGTVNSATDKDFSTVTNGVLTISDHASHTHSVTITNPGLVVNFIIKT